MKFTKSQLRQVIKEELESVIQEAGWKYKKAVDQQIYNARNWKALKEPLGEITEMIDELWRNWYADHIVVRDLDPLTKVADDIKRKNYRVPDPSGLPKLPKLQEVESIDEYAPLRYLHQQMEDPKFHEKESKRIKAYLERETAKIPGRIRELERKVDKIMDSLKLKKEGYPGLQGEDITTVANGPPRKK